MSEDRERFLMEPNIAVLATQGADGQPHAAPVWYLYEDGEFMVATDKGGQKHKDVERSPKVTLVVDRRELPYHAVMVRGSAEVAPPLDDEQRLRLAIRYLGEELGRQYASQGAGDVVTLRIRSAKFIEYKSPAR